MWHPKQTEDGVLMKSEKKNGKRESFLQNLYYAKHKSYKILSAQVFNKSYAKMKVHDMEKMFSQ